MLISTAVALRLDTQTQRNGTHQHAPEWWDKHTTKENKAAFLKDLFEKYPQSCEDDMSVLNNPKGIAELAETSFEDLPIILWMYVRLGCDLVNDTFTCELLRRRIAQEIG